MRLAQFARRQNGAAKLAKQSLSSVILLGKVKFEYIGPVDSEAAQKAEAKVQRRKDIEKKLSRVEENFADVERGLRGRR